MFPKVLLNLPKSGSWLNTIKVVLGFVELALALKFLSNADLVAHYVEVDSDYLFVNADQESSSLQKPGGSRRRFGLRLYWWNWRVRLR